MRARRPAARIAMLVASAAAVGFLPTATSASATTVTGTIVSYPFFVPVPGTPDTTFGAQGLVSDPAGSNASAVAVLPGGQIVAAEAPPTAGSSTAIVEYSSGGGSPTALGSFPGQAFAIAVDSGNVIVAGKTNTGFQYPGTASCPNAAAVQAIKPGSGQQWIVGVDCGESSQFSGLAVDSAGNVIAAGMALDRAAGMQPATLVARMTPTGVLDSATPFGTGGVVESPLPGQASSGANAVAVTGAGSTESIYVTGAAEPNGSTGQYVSIAKLTNTGAPDPTFNSTGVVAPPIGSLNCSLCSAGNGIAVRTVGTATSVVVAGSAQTSSGTQALLLQYGSDGNPTPGFGSNGQVLGPSLGTLQTWHTVAYDPLHDLITVAGSAGPTTASQDMVVAQFGAPTGALNTAFDHTGYYTRSFSGQAGHLESVVIQPNGATLAAGRVPTTGNASNAALLRLYGPQIVMLPPPIFQVTSTGVTTVNFTVGTNELLAVPTLVTLCSAPGVIVDGQGQCATVTIPAGSSTTNVPVSLDVTVPVGNSQNVPLGVQSGNNVAASPTNSTVTGSVQHLLPPPPFNGYWMVASDGGVFNFGTAGFYGSAGNLPLVKPIVGMAVKVDGSGYWLVASDGGIFSYHTGFYGSAGNLRLVKPIVGMAATPDGKGYWLVASDGGIFNYGDAKLYGSAGNLRLAKPIVGMAATPDGKGYWLVASDGGIFSYGDAKFEGSAGNLRLAKPIVGMAAYPGAPGYWLVASDGGIFSYGAALFHGSAGNLRLAQPVVGMASSPDGKGYWLVASDGGIFSYGDAQFKGSTGAIRLAKPIVGMAE